MSKPTTVDEYLESLPEDRKQALQTVRETILKNLAEGYEEGIQYGMIGYYVPHSVYPPGYHCDKKQPLPFAGLGSQKNHMAIYLMCTYGDPVEDARFKKAWLATGRKLDMGKSCVRFKSIDDVALDVLGETIKRIPTEKYIEVYESNIMSATSKRAAKKNTKKKAATKKVAKKTATKTTPKKKTSKKVVKKKPAAKKKTAKKAAVKKKKSSKRK
jgi:hypothetical protein